MNWNAVANFMNSDVVMMAPLVLFVGFLLVRYVLRDRDGDSLSNDVEAYTFLGLGLIASLIRAAAIALLLIMVLVIIVKVLA